VALPVNPNLEVILDLIPALMGCGFPLAQAQHRRAGIKRERWSRNGGNQQSPQDPLFHLFLPSQ
jgi:hypothetical protein